MMQDSQHGINVPPIPPPLLLNIDVSRDSFVTKLPHAVSDNRNLETIKLVRDHLVTLNGQDVDQRRFDDVKCLKNFITETLYRSELRDKSWRELIVEDKLYYFVQHFDTEPILQNGQSCGFAALSMALQILIKSDSLHLPGIEQMVNQARSEGLTNYGEMFSADALLKFACDFFPGITGQVSSDQLSCLQRKKLILESLMQKHLVLIPYDKGPNNEPCFKSGLKAHWAVLTGFIIVMTKITEDLKEILHEHPNDGRIFAFEELSCCPEYVERVSQMLEFDSEGETRIELFVFARQGKSLRLHLWNFDKLIESNRQLIQNPLEHCYVLPEGGIEMGLSRKVVILKTI